MEAGVRQLCLFKINNRPEHAVVSQYYMTITHTERPKFFHDDIQVVLVHLHVRGVKGLPLNQVSQLLVEGDVADQFPIPET